MKKKLIYSVFMVLALWQAKAQVVTIPDINFKRTLIDQGVDLNSNGQIEINEAATVTYISANGHGIHDMTGIEAFINLDGLYIDENQLTRLDLSKNVKLTNLHAQDNQLRSLNLSRNTRIGNLLIGGNQLDSLDFRANPSLSTLYCNNNVLKSLRVSSNTQLYSLYCQNNLLSSLDISSLGNLLYLNISNNPSLDFLCLNRYQHSSLSYNAWRLTKDANTELTIDCNRNAPSSNIIPFGNFRKALIDLGYDLNHDNGIQLSEITGIETLQVNGWAIDNMDGIEYMTQLTLLNGEGNNMTHLDISHNTRLKNLYLNNNKLVGIDLSANIELELLQVQNNKLDTLDLTHTTKLRSLQTFGCKIKRLDLSHNIELRSIICGGSDSLKSVDLTQNVNLAEFSCVTSSLESLDITNNIQLTSLQCGGSPLRSLDVSQNLLLQSLSCDYTDLPSLNVSPLIYLTQLSVYSNPNLWQVCISPAQLVKVQNRTLTVEGARDLVTDCRPVPASNIIPDLNFRKWLISQGRDFNDDNGIQANEVVSMDTLRVLNKSINSLEGIAYFENLKFLDCSGNPRLSIMDLSALANLTYLNCSGNNLQILNLSSNPELKYLDCSKNILSVLDLFSNTKLVKVYCYNNYLTSFKISKYKNTTLRTLVITNNFLQGVLNLRTSTYLDKVWCYNNPLSEICVANVNKAQTSTEYRKDQNATWTNNCGWVPREGAEFEDEVSESFTTLYPNPAKGKVMVETNEQVAGIFVKSLDGIVLLQTADTKEVDIKSLSAGIYLVEIHTPFTTETKKLVVE